MRMREDLESRIKEQRTAEANKKGLMGQSGKIGAVLRTLGSPIVAQTEMSSYLDTEGRSEELQERRTIPVFDAEGVERPTGPEWSEAEWDATPYSAREIGMHFDGLARGMHMEIIYKEDSSELKVNHRGYLVYCEVQGDLQCYIPSEEWEGWVESLYKSARKIQRERKEDEFKEKVRRADDAKKSWLKDMAARWGIS
jgi:hypothetical protein